MKKILITLLVALLAVSGSIAADTTPVSNAMGTKATTEATLDLSGAGDSDLESFKFGFLKTDLTNEFSMTTNVINHEDDGVKLSLDGVKATNKPTTSPGDPTFAFCQIISGANYSVKLKIEETTPIKSGQVWTVKWGDNDSQKTTTSDADAKLIFSHIGSGSEGDVSTASILPLTIEIADISKIKKGTYTATLTMSVETGS